MATLIEKIKEKTKKIKVEYLIVFIAVIAIFIIFLSSFNTNTNSTASADVDKYISSLEKKLSTELSKIDGAGSVSVLISVKRGVTTEIATEKKIINNSDGITTEEIPILVSGKPIILTEVYPEITGVIIIAKGAEDLKVRMSLLTAAQTFLAITSDKIEILTMR